MIMMYFTFTSLSTVGFGDYHPKSDVERLWTAFALMMGVAFFALIIGNLLEMIDEYTDFHSDYGDPANL